MPEVLRDKSRKYDLDPHAYQQPFLEIYFCHTQSWRYRKSLDSCTVFFLKLGTVAIPNLFDTKVQISLARTRKYMFLKRFQNVIILQFVFQGKRGKGYQGDIALDDIRVLDGSCPPSRMLNFAIVFNILVVFPCKIYPSFSPYKVRGILMSYQTKGLR